MTHPFYNFSGKVILLTGAGSQLGRALSCAFADAGAWVALTDPSQDLACDTLKELLDNGGEGVYFPSNLKSSQQCHELLSRVRAKMGSISGIVNHGDLATIKMLLDAQISLLSTMEIESIVNLLVDDFVHRSIKAHTEEVFLQTTQEMAIKAALFGVRVNAIRTGLIESPQVSPLGRKGTAADVAAATLWLVSDQSSFLTGQVMTIDGGLSLAETLPQIPLREPEL